MPLDEGRNGLPSRISSCNAALCHSITRHRTAKGRGGLVPGTCSSDRRERSGAFGALAPIRLAARQPYQRGAGKAP